MLILICVVTVTIGFFTAYVVSLYSLAVYIDPEEVDTLLAGASRRKRKFLRKLAIFAGGTAAALTILPALENNYLKAFTPGGAGPEIHSEFEISRHEKLP